MPVVLDEGHELVSIADLDKACLNDREVPGGIREQVALLRVVVIVGKHVEDPLVEANPVPVGLCAAASSFTQVNLDFCSRPEVFQPLEGQLTARHSKVVVKVKGVNGGYCSCERESRGRALKAHHVWPHKTLRAVFPCGRHLDFKMFKRKTGN